MSKVTIEDISRATGLSRGTVSRALNDRPDISAATKLKVLEACRKLNYAPSHAARSLATGRHFALAAIVRDLKSAFDIAFLRGVLKHATLARYAVNVVELHDPDSNPTVAVTADRVDGALIGTPLAPTEAAWLRDALPSKTVTSVSPIDGLECDVFTPDQAECGRLAARELMRAAGDQIRYVHVYGQPDADARRSGFLQECAAAGITPDQVMVECSEDQWRGGAALGEIMARLSAARGVAACDDAVALTVLLAAGRNGRVAGKDFCLIGQGNDPISARVRPALTTIDPSAEEIGQRAMQTFLQRANEGRKDAPQLVHVAPVLVERSTSRLID